MKTFRAALEIITCHRMGIALGGGEPTLHPLFDQILREAIASCESTIFVATNGKITRKALMIAQLAKNGSIYGALSIDDFHEPIDPKVVKAFEHDNGLDHREIRDVGRGRLSRSGRAKTMPNQDRYNWYSSCFCEEIFVKPNGDMYQCGCEHSTKIGTVFDPPNDFENICYERVLAENSYR
jgi:hypothetical protein